MLRRIIVLATIAVTAVCAFSASPASAQYNPNFITCSPVTLAPNGTVNCSAGYYKPGATVTFEIHSTPVVLGTAVANDVGVATGSFVVPASVDLGGHTIVATGAAIGGSVTAELTLTADVSIASSVTASPSTSSGSLPTTGNSDTGLLTAAGAGLIAIGGITVLATRRRREVVRHD